jgi:hypothetical protein
VGFVRTGFFVRIRGSGWGFRGGGSWVDAGLLLLKPAVVICWLYFLSLLATVRGGTSFLFPHTGEKETEAKKTPLNNRRVSVPSVQARSFWHLIAWCSPDSRMFEPLLLANPDTNTLRPQRSRARTPDHGPARPHVWCLPHFVGGWRRGLRGYFLRGLSADSAG